MPKYNEYQYNEETLKGYLNNYQYTNAVNYLKSFNLSNPDKQRELDMQIRKLQDQANIIEGVLSNQNEHDSDIIKFAISAKNGTINTDTNYGQKYSEILGRIGSYGKHQATSLRVQFDNNDRYLDFLNTINLSESDLEKKGIKSGSSNGVRNITFDKSNPEVINIIQGLYETKDKIGFLDTGNILSNVKTGALTYLMSSNHPFSQFFGREAEGYLMRNVITGFDIIGIDSTGKDIINDDESNHKLNRLNRMLNRANTTYENALSTENKANIRSSNIITTDFMGAADAQLSDYLAKGLIETTEYNRVKENLQNIYTRRIVNEGFASRNIYLSDGESDTFSEVLDSKEKAKYSEILRSAANEGKRIQIAAAMSGSMSGTLITISAKPDSNGNIPNQGKKKSKNANAEYRIFIPNLFNDEVEESFNRNTETRAVRSYNNLKSYANNKEFLADGYVVHNVTNDGGFVSNPKLGIEAEYKPTNELIRFLDEAYIKEDAVRYYSREYDNIPRKKDLYLNANGKEVSLTGTKTPLMIEQEVIDKSFAAAKEVVGNDNSPEYTEKVLEFYNYILDGINYTEARQLILK